MHENSSCERAEDVVDTSSSCNGDSSTDGHDHATTAAHRWKTAFEKVKAIHRFQTNVKATMVQREWLVGAELYMTDDQQILSADAAATIVSNSLGKDCSYTDFECETPETPMNVTDFERFACDFASREGMNIDPTLRRMFDAAAGTSYALFVSHRQLRDAIEEVGLRVTDPRLDQVGVAIQDETLLDTYLNPLQFVELVSPVVYLLHRVLLGKLAIRNFHEFSMDLERLYELVEPEKGGHNAAYISCLAEADPEKWGVAFCSVDGQRFAKGDTDDVFTIPVFIHI